MVSDTNKNITVCKVSKTRPHIHKYEVHSSIKRPYQIFLLVIFVSSCFRCHVSTHPKIGRHFYVQVITVKKTIWFSKFTFLNLSNKQERVLSKNNWIWLVYITVIWLVGWKVTMQKQKFKCTAFLQMMDLLMY